jgi:hypothetical protein
MNKKDLDALKELYSSVYDEEQLNEAPGGKARFWDSIVANTGRTAGDVRDVLYGDPSGSASRDARQRLSQRVTGKPVKEYPDQRAARISRAQDAAIAAADKAEKPPTKPPAKPTPAKSTPASTPTAARPAAGSGSTPPPRPAARPSGPVLSKRKGVEGTGVGADFKERAFTAAEKSRYSSVAAQNAAKSSAASATPKPSSPTPAASAPKPAIGVLGKTSFERRTPTSAELSGARGAPAGSTPEQRLQAAQKTNLPTTGPSVDLATARSSVATAKATANSPAVINRPAPAGSALAKQQAQQKSKPPTPGTMTQSYEWPSAKTIRDIAGAYSSIYEAKKKVDQDEDGDNDFGDVRIARMIASGVPKAKAIAMVKNKSYNEEVELWVNELVEEGYDLSEYTWEDMFDIYEATRMGKELGKEGEIATRKQLAARSDAHQRSGSVDKTIAAAERRAERPYVKPVRDENESDYNKRLQKSSDTMSKLAASRRGSVRDNPRAGLRGYAADVKGSDKELQSSRRSAMAAGTLTPREKKMLNKEAYETYEFVASYLLENNFASTVEDANVIINNMSENWFESIIEEKKPLPVAKMKRKEEKLDRELESELPKALRTEIDSPERKELLRKNRRFGDMHDVRRSVSTRGGKRPLQMPEVGRYKPKDED